MKRMARIAKYKLVGAIDYLIRHNRRFAIIRWLEAKLYPCEPECVDWDAIGEDVYPWN